jgi:hypothetical protein
MKIQHPESVEYSKSHAEGKIHSYKYLHLKFKNLETSQINNLMIISRNLKVLEKQEQTKPKTSRRREIIKIKAEINEIEI